MNEDVLKQNEALIDELIEGTGAYEPYTFEGLKGPLQMRKLNAKEVKILKKSEKKNVKSQMTLKRGQKRNKKEIRKQVENLEQEIDHERLVENTESTKYLAIELSAGLPIEKIEGLPQKIVDDIFEKIIEINDLTKDDLSFIANFRQDEEGEDDVQTPDDGDPDQ